MRYELTINGQKRELDVPANVPLLWALRDDLGLTGTRYGCGRGQCGACHVIADGHEIASCLVTVDQAARENMKITTVEGLAAGGALGRVQQAFIDEDAMQCGYCTSGMLIGAAALLMENPRPDEAAIKQRMAGHLCRCGVYNRVVRAIQRAGTAT
jgi:isoquinoline 1-oxidoreductase alpha subunit